jgi:hypothetical protein
MIRRTRKDSNVRVLGPGPITGEDYLRLQQKLQLDLGDYQALMGITMKEHYLIAKDPKAPLTDPGLCLHIRLLDEYPGLIAPGPDVLELTQTIKRLKHDYPDIDLPMPASSSLIALMLGRNARTATTWNQGKAVPARKILALVDHLQTLFDRHDAPDRALVRYCELIDVEARARGVENIFVGRNWSPAGSDED